MIGRRGPSTTGRGGAVVCALVLIVAACGSGSHGTRHERAVLAHAAPAPSATPIDPALRARAVRGAAALSHHLAQMDPASLAIPDYLARRYGLASLSDAGARARRLLHDGNHAGGSTTLDALIDPQARRPSAQQLRSSPPYEQAIAAALFCPSTESASLARRIRSVARPGGYALTHATLAFELARERRCFPGARASVLRRQLATAIRAELGTETVVDDLAIERLAILALLGEPAPVEWVSEVAAAQHADGSWTDPTGRVPMWHPTMLGVWVMAAASERGTPIPFVADGKARPANAAGPDPTAQFTGAEAERMPRLDRRDEAALQRLSRDPPPSASEAVTMRDAMSTMVTAPEVPVADAQLRSEIARDLASARAVARRFSTPSRARAAGYRLASRALPGIGAHWVDWSRVVGPFAAASPAMLLFDRNDERARLAGLSYLVRSRTEPDGFRTAGATWHRHAGLCIVHGVLVGEGMAQRSCQTTHGTYLPGRDLWMLHVWVAPRFVNPWGTFAAMDPALCSAERPCTPGV